MVKFSRLAALLVGVCAAAVATHAAAAAPTAPAAPSSNTAADAPIDQIGEVVVTAQRRSEHLQDVPLAVSVISAQQLDTHAYTGLTDLQLLVPSLQYNAYVGGAFQVRGVGTQTVNLSTEQDVAVVIDDVVQGLPELTFAEPSYQALTDIDRVEVLKGPQGTLFGKNSSVGVVQIVTKKPQLNAYEADASVSAATQGEYNFTTDANLPLGQTAALRLSGFEYHHDGFIKNVYDDKEIGGFDQYGGRGKLLWEPTNALTIYLIGEYIRTEDTGNGAWTLRSCGSGFGAFSACATDAPYGIVPGPNNRQVALDAETPADTTTTSGSLHIDYQIGRDTLSSITAYVGMDSYENVDVDNSPRPILDHDTTWVQGREFTQELRLTSPSDQLVEYTVGAYYYNVASHLQNLLAGTFGFEPDDSVNLLSNGFAGLVSGGLTALNSHTQSYALYGQATIHATSKLSLIGGLRYSYDDVSADVHTDPYPNVCEFDYAFGAPCHTVTLPSPVVTQSTTASNVSGKATLKYAFTDRINAYASFSSGYKGPAISYGALLPFRPVQPETSTAYEIGVKSELLDRSLIINADAFYERYKNFQADTYVLNAADPAASNFELANAGGLESKGIEGDVTWRATHELTLSGNVAYVPTKFTDFVIQCQSDYANPANGPCDPTGTTFNARGYPLPQAPEVAYTLQGDYHHELGGGLALDADLNWSWRSSTYTMVADRSTIQPAYGVLGGQVGVGAADGRWRVSLFARNLLNQHFVAAIFQTYLDSGLAAGKSTVIGYSNVPTIESEQTIGVKLSVKLGS
jgi:iron complex outermembrane receptor protein